MARKMIRNAIGSLQHYLFVHFPRAETFTSTDYTREEQLKPQEEQKKLRENRFAGYKALCTFGLGSLFWGSATGVLSGWKGEKGWLEYFYIHSIVTFVLLLNGLIASTFHTTAWLAPSAAGLGSLSALILFLGTAHIMSLKFHSYDKECLHSMIASSAIITIYWIVSVQDPLLLYFVLKTILWIIGFLIYITACILYLLYLGFTWCIVRLFSMFWQFVWTNENSIKNRLVGASTRDYVQLPGETA